MSPYKKMQDMTAEEFTQLLKELQVQYLEPKIQLIVQAEVVKIRGDVFAGFPLNKLGEPDIDGHRSYHEALIGQAMSRAEFWQKLTYDLTRWGLLIFLAWSLLQLWPAFLKGPVK